MWIFKIRDNKNSTHHDQGKDEAQYPVFFFHDDHTVAKKLGKTASRVAGALCYHYNPGSAEEVFASAQWIGKSDKQPNSTKEWLRRSPPGALKRGIARAIEEKEPFYIIFEQVYSLGILTGMFWRNILHRDHSR